MENRNILDDQDVDEDFEEKESQHTEFGSKLQSENRVINNRVTESKKINGEKEIILWNSDMIINANNLSVEWESLNRFMNRSCDNSFKKFPRKCCEVPPNLDEPCRNLIKYQNTESMCLQDFMKESAGNFETSLLKKSKVNDSLSCVKLHYSKHYYKHLIDQTFYELRKEKETARSTSFKLNCSKQYCNQVQASKSKHHKEKQETVHCHLEHPFQNNSKKTEATDRLSSNVKLYYSKHYYKYYYKHLLDEVFYKLKKETQTKPFKSISYKSRHQTQYCNQMQDSSANNTVNENNEKPTSLYVKNMRIKKSSLMYGYHDEILNSIFLKNSEHFKNNIFKTKSSTDASKIFLLDSRSSNAMTKSVNEILKIDEGDVQSTFMIDEERKYGITSLEEICRSCSNEGSQLKNEVWASKNVQPCTSFNKFAVSEKVIHSHSADLKKHQKITKTLFADLKTDNVKRVSEILDPRYGDSRSLLGTLNDTENQILKSVRNPSAEESLTFPHRLEGKESKSGKRKLFSDPKVDRVKRVCSMLEPRYKF